MKTSSHITGFVIAVLGVGVLLICQADDPQTGPDGLTNFPLSSTAMVQTPSCDSSTLLSRSPYFADFEATVVEAAPFVPKFSKYIDVEGQDVTKFQRKDGLRVYEASPRIIPLIYKGSWKTYRREQRIYAKKSGGIAFAKPGYRYYWEGGAVAKDPVSKMYSLKPSKFKVFLSHRFKIPEWWAEGEVSAWDKERWDYLYCRTAVHERTHAEITRRHILGTIDEILDLRAPTPEALKTSIKKTWTYKRAELRVKQKFFDAETRRKRRTFALNKCLRKKSPKCPTDRIVGLSRASD